MNYLGLDLASLIVTIIAVFIAGVIRGYSGFGFAMVAVTSISLVIPPARVVPLVLILEIMSSISLVPQVWRDIDWYSLRWLLGGAIVLGLTLAADLAAELLAAVDGWREALDRGEGPEGWVMTGLAMAAIPALLPSDRRRSTLNRIA